MPPQEQQPPEGSMSPEEKVMVQLFKQMQMQIADLSQRMDVLEQGGQQDLTS